MTSLNISLPKPLKNYVEAQVNSGHYSTPSEYLRTLIREDRTKKERDRIEAMLLKSVQSGEPREANKEFWEKKQRELGNGGRRKKNTRS